ncbi:MAG: exodeoxyribonuclease VII small subunit [Bacilli bacterium]|nr:exodeoxyribonuclease VII small subunit [Bacilli bacterium]
MEKTFETALKELEMIVKKLESGNIPLENAINEYTEAMQLVKFCSEKLNNATEQVNKTLSENGELKDFELNEETDDDHGNC